MRGPAKTALLAALFSALIAPGCVEELLQFFPDDDFGDNHSFATAADITTDEGSVLMGGLTSSPTDYFLIDIGGSGGSALMIAVTAGTASFSSLALSLYEDDGSGGQTFLTDTVTDADPVKTLLYTEGGTVSPNTYYVIVEGSGTFPYTDYSLTWTLTP